MGILRHTTAAIAGLAFVSSLAGCPADFHDTDSGSEGGADSSVTDDSAADSSMDSSFRVDSATGNDAADSGSPIDSGADTGPLPETGPPADGGCGTGAISCDGGCVANGPQNCGTCGHDCTTLPNVSGQVLCGAGGTCEFDGGACAAGYAHCTGAPDQGCETPIDTTSNCGACGTTCSGGTPNCAGAGNSYSCSSGCPANAPKLCGTTCVDWTSDSNNCGACSNKCSTTIAHATPICSNSACTYTCNGGYTACSGGCADFSSDSNNCGSCGNVCAPGTICSGSHCVCNSVSGCNGCCSSATTCEAFGSQTSSSCGNGGAMCGSCSVTGQTCASVSNGGACQCPAGDTVCANTCVNTMTNSNYCGACNKSCSSIVGSSCVSGVCQCPSGQQNCSGSCVDEQGDSNNCGACGHSCLGGACVSGQCQPTPIGPASTAGGGTVTTDGTNVYWTDGNGNVYSCNGTTGCGLTPKLVFTESTTLVLGNFLVSGSTMYFSDDTISRTFAGRTQYVKSCLLSACSATINTIYTFNPPGGDFTFANSDIFAYGTSTGIYDCNPLMPATSNLFEANAVPPGSRNLVNNGSSVFFVNPSNVIQSCPATFAACAAATTIVTAPTWQGSSLAADSQYVYWIDNNGVEQCPVTSGCPGGPVALTSVAGAGTPVSDGSNVYWSNTTTLDVYRAPAGGPANSAQVIAQSQALLGGGGIAVGPKAVYFPTSNGLMLLAK